MRSIEIIIDAEEKQDEHDLMAMFITMASFCDGIHSWRETTSKLRGKGND